MVSTRVAATAALSMASAAMAAPNKPTYDTLMGYPPEGIANFKAEWAKDAPIPERITLDKASLASKNFTAAKGFVPKGKRDVLGGYDDREAWSDTSFPYSAMGKITWSSGVWCSGSLVGPKHVATAKHCAPYPEDNVSVRFMPGYNNGEQFAGANVVTILSLPEYDVNDNPDSCDWKEDWAVFILDAYLGDAQGYLGVSTPADDQTEQPLFWNYGYPGDLGGETPYVMDNSMIYAPPYGCDAYGPYNTDTDVAGGQSGGPFWIPDDNWYQYAICSGSSSANSIFSGGNNWVNAVNQARVDYP